MPQGSLPASPRPKAPPGASLALALLLPALTATLPRPAVAQMACSVLVPVSASWSPPLERTITLELGGRTLAEALDQVAAAAGVRLSYGGDHLPDTGSLCWTFEDVPLGQALEALLAGAALEPVAAGAELVVLAPAASREPAREAETTTPLETPLFNLDPVVVRVDTRTVEERTSPVHVHVVSGDELRRRGATSWSQVLNGSVPGVWSWQPSSSGLVTSFGSIRGASTFGLQAPKVYLDGIELANPLVAARLSPDAIERIEVIRGPEGSALYGAGAIAGVTNIVTRHDWGGEGASRIRVRSSLGLAGSDFAAGSAVSQDHRLGVNFGSARRSVGLNLSASQAPEVVPGGASRYLGLDGSLRVLTSKALLTGTLRLSDERTALPASPLLGPLAPDAPASAFSDQLGLTRYTAGVRALLSGQGRWSHTVVLGLDGYGLDGLTDDPDLLPSLADSALLAAGAGATRGSFRLSSSRALHVTDGVESTLTLGVEQSVLFRREWDRNRPAGQHAAGAQDPGALEPVPGSHLDAAGPAVESTLWDTGLSARLGTSFFDRVFLTGGLRLERNVGGALTSRVAALPTLGATLNAGRLGPVGVELRAAYGRAIRWPELPASLLGGSTGVNRGGAWGYRGVGLSTLSLGPEEQSGIETGLDLTVGSDVALSLTRFDQTSTGFLESGEPLEGGGPGGGARALGPRHLYPVQSVGMIDNTGWEMEASLQRGPLSLAGTFSLVDSRVRSLGASYHGDLLPGDRMLGVPSRTLGLNATWSAPNWSTTLGLARAFDWVGYDRVLLAGDFATSPEGVSAAGLRDYWRLYDGFTHLSLSGSRSLSRGVTLLLSVENLLDRQVGEPDNATVVPGRTVTVGVSAGIPWWK